MAKMYEVEIQAQQGIYVHTDRTIKIYFSEPEQEINKETGVLLLIGGYGQHANLDVCKETREKLSDAYNLVTVQCDYFGFEYMQNDTEIDITEEMLEQSLTKAELDLLQRDYDKYAHILNGKIFHQFIDKRETLESFNDMGLMQAMDNLRAIKVVLDILKDNKYQINENRIYAYGFSHGAYLTYLCNAFCPGLFTAIVDNSAYITPYFLKNERIVDIFQDGIQIKQIEKYKAVEYMQDEEILDLSKVYQQFSNKAYIFSYAGEKDTIISLEEKKAFLNKIENVKVETITEYRVDRVYFKSASHELGADLLLLFNHADYFYLRQKEVQRKKKRQKHHITYEDMIFETTKFCYDIKWEDGIPVLYRNEKI